MGKTTPNKEQAILQAAEHEFLTKGFDGARTTSIAQAAGVTHAMLHYYFRTKEHIFNRILDEKMRLMGQSILTSFGQSGLPLQERLSDGIGRHFDLIAANPDLPRFIVNEVFSRPERYDAMRSRIRGIADTLMRDLQKELNDSAEQGLTEPIDARMLLLDIISLNVFSFIAYPILEPVLGDLTADRARFFALRKAGYEVVMVNSNPETVSTDYDTSDKLYFEPLTLEDVMNIYEREQCFGVIVQFGGQTPLNLAQQLRAAGANVIGTSPDDIDAAEDRDYFRQLSEKIGILQPPSGIAHSVEEAVAIAEKIGYPLLVRPSFVLGGRGMVIVYKEAYLRKYVEAAAAAAEGKPILIDRFLEDAVELDVDCISDGHTSVIGAIMEHVEPAGIHSGDSASVIPPMTLAPELQEKVRNYAHAFAKELHVCGLMNMQLAVKDGEIYIIEVNPRASRTVPFVSKAIGVPLAGLAARCMVGETLESLGFTREVKLPYTAVKEAVFPFVKFPGVDIMLSPEMKSTGEVMSIDPDRGLAYLKSQVAAGSRLPTGGNVFLSVRDEDKPRAVELARQLVKLGFGIYATRGTSTLLWDAGIKTQAIYRISRGRPNLLDLLHEKQVQWIVNTTENGAEAMVDEIRMRSLAVSMGIPVTTTLSGLTAAIEGLTDKLEFGRFEVCSLQEYHRHVHTGRRE